MGSLGSLKVLLLSISRLGLIISIGLSMGTGSGGKLEEDLNSILLNY
jgi:hypothetical protein